MQQGPVFVLCTGLLAVLLTQCNQTLLGLYSLLYLRASGLKSEAPQEVELVNNGGPN